MDRNFENLPNHSQERTVETKPATLAPQHRTPRAHFEDLEAPPIPLNLTYSRLILLVIYHSSFFC